jgi:hypothetical protein
MDPGTQGGKRFFQFGIHIQNWRLDQDQDWKFVRARITSAIGTQRRQYQA